MVTLIWAPHYWDINHPADQCPGLSVRWFQNHGFLGMDVAMIGYQGTVFPVLIAVWFMSHLEKQLRRVLSQMHWISSTPFWTVVITGFVSLLLSALLVAA